jgi:cytochrome c oxidase subunit 1
MPFQSVYPLVTSIGILIGAIGVSVIDHGHKLPVALTGAVIMLAGIYLWAMEGNEGYHIHADEEDSHK